MRENTPVDTTITAPSPEDTAMHGWVEDEGPYLWIRDDAEAPDEIDEAASL